MPSLGNTLPGHPQAPPYTNWRERPPRQTPANTFGYIVQKDSFYIVQNRKLSYEHGPLQSPNQPSFYREVATHNPFQRTEEKLGTISSPPAPGSSRSEAEESSRQPRGQRAREGGPLREGQL